MIAFGSTRDGRNLEVIQTSVRGDMRSRMSREAHVRIFEGLGVRLPQATRL